MSLVEIVAKAGHIPSMTQATERMLLARLAQDVPDGGQIVETGCLYGGTVAVMALANPNANIVTLDKFEWFPKGHPNTDAEKVMLSLSELGISNVLILTEDTREMFWVQHISLLFIDGGHDYETAKSDLCKFGILADVIAVHDYLKTNLPEVKQAVDEFLVQNPTYYLESITHSTALLRKHVT